MSNELTDVVKHTQMLRDELMTKCSELPSALVNVMLSRFTVNGAIPVTVDDIKALLNSVLTQMRAELRDALPAATHTPASSQPVDPLADPRSTCGRGAERCTWCLRGGASPTPM